MNDMDIEAHQNLRLWTSLTWLDCTYYVDKCKVMHVGNTDDSIVPVATIWKGVS